MGILFRPAGGTAEMHGDLRRLAILQFHLLLRGRVLVLSQPVAHTPDVAEDLRREHPTRVAISL